MHPAAGQFEVRVLDHTLDGGDADPSCRPLHDPQTHLFPFQERN
jgi:hypothetical protein